MLIKTIMKPFKLNFKETIIHLLGGVTIEESKESDKNSFAIGQWTALLEAKSFAESINGAASDDWCKAVYNHLCERIERIKHYEQDT